MLASTAETVGVDIPHVVPDAPLVLRRQVPRVPPEGEELGEPLIIATLRRVGEQPRVVVSPPRLGRQPFHPRTMGGTDVLARGRSGTHVLAHDRVDRAEAVAGYPS